MATSFGLHAADWSVFGVIIFISFAIAVINFILSRKKTQQVDEYLMGSRDLPLFPAIMSVMASFISTIAMIGFPGEVFLNGPTFFFIHIGYTIGALICVFVVIPLIFPLNLSTPYEYLELRYDAPSVRRVAAIAGILFQISYMGLCIFGPCIALETLVGFAAWKGVLIVGILGTIPTVIGGLKGVIWMDFFQGVIMYGMLVAIVIAGAASLGGFRNAAEVFFTYSKPINTKFSFTEFNMFTGLIGPMTEWIGTMGFTQAAFQRYAAVQSINRSKLVMGLGITFQSIFSMTASLCGIVLFAFYAGRGCDPVGSGQLSNVNGLVPDLVQRILGYPGVPGLFVGAVFSASYSTVTSCLTGIAGSLWEDLLKDFLGERSAVWQLTAIRLLVIVFGLMGMGIAYACIYVGGPMFQLYLAFSNSLIGPMMGMFLLSAMLPQANYIGALSGGMSSFAIMMWMGLSRSRHVMSNPPSPTLANVTCPLYTDLLVNSSNILQSSADAVNYTYSLANTTLLTATTTPASPGMDASSPLYLFYAIQPMWYSPIGCLLCMAVGVIVSFATRTCSTKVEPGKEMFFNFMQCCLKGRPSGNYQKEYSYQAQPTEEKRKMATKNETSHL